MTCPFTEWTDSFILALNTAANISVPSICLLAIQSQFCLYTDSLESNKNKLLYAYIVSENS